MGFSENMGSSVRIQARDNSGRFVRLLDGARDEATRRMTDRAVELARQNARPMRKSGRLEAGIVADYRGGVGYVRSTAPHAHPVEKGSLPHDIPHAFGQDEQAHHPGNKAQPYLDQVPSQLLHDPELQADVADAYHSQFGD